MSSKRKTKTKKKPSNLKKRELKRIDQKLALRALAATTTKKKKRGKFNAVRLGQSVGGMFGPGGAMVGKQAGLLFRQLTGFGEYKVNRNSLAGVDSLPMFANTRHGTVVRHREFLGDVITSSVPGVFRIDTFPIQPALLSTFPWLAPIAEQFDEYTIEGMVFEFKSNSYDALASVNTASGTVIMTTQYNVLAPPFTNKLQMEQYEFTCSEKPSVSILHPVECSRIETPTSVLTTRSGPAPGDLRLYDWGNFNIATVGMQGASVNVGELWVTYDVKFYKPRQSATSDVADHYTLEGKAASFAAAGGPNYLGTIIDPPFLSSSSDMGTFLTASSSINLDTINWPNNYYGNVAVLYRWYSTATSLTPTPNTSYNVVGSSPSIVPLKILTSNDYISSGPFSNQMVTYTANGAQILVLFSINGGGSIKITGGTNTTLASFDLLIMALPISLTN